MSTAQIREQKANLKGLLKNLRRGWKRGTYSDFDEVLARIAECNLGTAEKIRENWLDLDLLGYDSEGYLVWNKKVWFTHES